MKENIYVDEIEYSCSPGGVDCWEIRTDDEDFFKGGFLSIEDAIGWLIKEFAGKELNLTIKSLEWYHNNQEEDN